ncbi:MAG TPA: hypothetical protein VMY37_25235, partial [Thermoguttaceae bacterium]|nr:hypothetical protein [Thermoguttaceae bacterium]
MVKLVRHRQNERVGKQIGVTYNGRIWFLLYYAARLVRIPSVITVLVIATVAGCDNPTSTASSDNLPSEMATTFQLPRGIQVADLTGIHEAYSVTVSQDGYHVFTV